MNELPITMEGGEDEPSVYMELLRELGYAIGLVAGGAFLGTALAYVYFGMTAAG